MTAAFMFGLLVGGVLVLITMACLATRSNRRTRDQTFNTAFDAGFQYGLKHADRCLELAARSLQG